MAILDKRKCRGLRSPCGPLVVSSSLPLPFSLGDALAEDEAKALEKGSSFPLVSLVGNGNDCCSPHGCRLSTLLRRLQRKRAAFRRRSHRKMTRAAAVCRA
jgi:hypothetical protein